MAKLGFGILVVLQNDWPKAAENIVNYREIALSAGGGASNAARIRRSCAFS